MVGTFKGICPMPDRILLLVKVRKDLSLLWLDPY
jgi:hypothetical protein